MIEKDFVQEGLRRTRIDEYLEKELERAGRKTWYGNWQRWKKRKNYYQHS